MKRYILILPFVLMVLVGCQTTRQASFKHSVNNPVSTSKFVYSPQGKEEFIFSKKDESLQEYGYDNFCGNTKIFPCHNRLFYSKYLGMRGFFDTEEPVKKHYSGYEFYPVILENGEQYYFAVDSERGGKYGWSSSIIDYKEYLSIKSFKPEALIENSSIILVSKKNRYGIKSFKLNNGKTIFDQQLKLIREVSKRFGNKPEIAEILLDMNINKDEMDFRYFVTPHSDLLRSDVRLYIGFNETDEWLRFKVKYYDDDWLFVNSYKIAADNYRWQSPLLTFERDYSSGSVWEWIDISANEKEIEVAKALATANKSTIRFQGDKYYSDKILQEDQKKAIQQIIKLFKLMKGS